jgi:hypothetical protein
MGGHNVDPTGAAEQATKTVADYSLLTYLWVVAMSIWGGIASYVNKVRRGELQAWSLMELIAEVVVAGFVGMLTFWLCEASSINPLLTAALVGISSHMGTRALFQLERLFSSRFGAR